MFSPRRSRMLDKMRAGEKVISYKLNFSPARILSSIRLLRGLNIIILPLYFENLYLDHFILDVGIAFLTPQISSAAYAIWRLCRGFHTTG